ncbi:hypothetical protein Tco_0877245 [Tanacetum coccineum]|uniref:Uncharacterized protein n=1 Tax=Tanacetum coccineum TaxID=301880 RepID=A0ABQ5BZS6_9ASTR
MPYPLRSEFAQNILALGKVGIPSESSSLRCLLIDASIIVLTLPSMVAVISISLFFETLEEVFQDFQDTYESSDDDTNFVNKNQEPFVVNQDPDKNSSQSPPHIDHCCYGCGDSSDDIFCQRCTYESCGKGTHIGYNFSPKVTVISKPEPCNNQTVNELLQILSSVHPTSCSGDENSFTYDSKPNFVDDSPNIFNPPPQPSMYSYEICGNDAYYGYNCSPQVPFIYNPKLSWSESVRQKKEEEEKGITEDKAAKDRYWKITICFDDDKDEESSIPLKDVIISGLPPCIAITPVLSTKEAVDSLIMEDEHLDTIPATESDEVIKSSVEELVLIPSESEGISDGVCDVPLCDNPTPLKAFKDHSEIVVNSNNDDTSSDDDDFEDIEYVEASPPDLEIVSLEEVNDVDQEKEEFDLEDILQIQDVILREKLLNISRLITNIEFLNDNPTPDRVLKSPSSVPISVTDSNSFFKKSDTSFSFSDNSLPEFETFSDHTEETRSGSTTTHANNSLPEYDSFLFEVEPDQGGLTSVVMDEISDNSTNDPLLELPEFESFHFDPSFPRPPPEPPDVEICLNFEPDADVINNFDELNEDECFDPG